VHWQDTDFYWTATNLPKGYVNLIVLRETVETIFRTEERRTAERFVHAGLAMRGHPAW
jgi:hypothetical protein